MAVNGSDGSCGSHSAISSFLAMRPDANEYCGRLLGKVLCQTPSVLVVTNYSVYVERFHFNA